MTFTDRLKDLMIEKNLNYNTLAKQTLIPVTTLSNYINRGSLPSITQLSILADFFNCSIDYLVGREDDFGIVQSSAPNSLTALESEILSLFRALDTSAQHKAIGYVYALGH